MYLMDVGDDTGAVSCSGWLSDKESFSKRVADRYRRDVLKQPPPLVKSIKQGSTVRWEVRYADDVLIYVVFAPGFVGARRAPSGPIRHYNFQCTTSGDLVLAERPLPQHP